VTDAEQIDALAFHLMTALDRIDELNAENEELLVKNTLQTKQLRMADELLTLLDDDETLGW
jgi:Tfp pilus assembly protein PilO